MSRDWGDRCSGVELSSFVITESWRLRDHLRWVFRKNSMEFSIGFDYLLILLYKWLCSTITQSHVFPEHSMITWLYYVIWLSNSPCYLYLVLVIWFDVGDQMFKYMENSFLSGALITLWHFYYLCFIFFLTISGHVAPFLAPVAYSISLSSSVYIHCI